MADQLAAPQGLAGPEGHSSTAVHPSLHRAGQVAIDVLVGPRLNHQPQSTAPIADHLSHGTVPPVADRRPERRSDVEAVVGFQAAAGAPAAAEVAGVPREAGHRKHPLAPAQLRPGCHHPACEADAQGGAQANQALGSRADRWHGADRDR